MSVRSTRIALAFGAGVLVATGIGLGYWWGLSRQAPEDAQTATTDRKVLYWHDPMVPNERYDKPGKSSMGMTLVPKYADEAGEGGIAIAPDTRQSLGIRTVEVKRGRLAGRIRVPGTITWDLRQERVVSARVDAIVERLFVKAPYEPVRAGQPLASVLAPAWSTAMAEARALGQARSAAARDLQSAAHERLRALGLPTGSGSRNGAIVLSAPVSGVVSEIGVREGQSTPAGTLLFRVNGTQTVWLEAALPQAVVMGIAAGTPVVASVSAMPGRRFAGRVETLLPQLDPASRTQRARIVLDNHDGLLAPGMFAEIELKPSGESEMPLVPTDAVIGSGGQARVIVQEGEGRFRPVAVQVGRSGGGFTEILSGLKGGERVVASGQFLIDSEASLSGALDRLGALPSVPDSATTPAVDTPPPDMSDTPSSPDTKGDQQHQHSTGHAAKPPVPPQASPEPPVIQPRTAPPAGKAERKVLYWYDPMQPDQHFDKPGKSPYMDMQLLPKYADEQDAEAQP